MLTLAIPGNSFIHRAPAWLKLALLAGIGVAVMLINNWGVLAAVLVGLAGLYGFARIPLGVVWRLTRGVLIFIAIIVAVQWWASSPALAAVIGERVLILIAAANLLTLTTAMSDLIACLEALVAPLRPLGVRPERVGITVALALRFIPVLIEQGRAIREAQAARGAKAWLTFLVPLLIRTLRMADGVGEALEVRYCVLNSVQDSANQKAP